MFRPGAPRDKVRSRSFGRAYGDSERLSFVTSGRFPSESGSFRGYFGGSVIYGAFVGAYARRFSELLRRADPRELLSVRSYGMAVGNACFGPESELAQCVVVLCRRHLFGVYVSEFRRPICCGPEGAILSRMLIGTEDRRSYGARELSESNSRER
ncbi:hypothetical protein Tco_1385024 [Tanacetum coccineum]